MMSAQRATGNRRFDGSATASPSFCCKDQPFFGSLALRLPTPRRPQPARPSPATAARFATRPEWIAATDSHDYVKTALARVVLACALKHHTRRAERDPQRWQHGFPARHPSRCFTMPASRLPPEAEAWEEA